MNHHHIDAHQLQQYDIADDGSPQLVGDHGIAAVLDHDGLTAVLLDIGQGLRQNLGPVGIAEFHFHGLLRYGSRR